MCPFDRDRAPLRERGMNVGSDGYFAAKMRGDIQDEFYALMQSASIYPASISRIFFMNLKSLLSLKNFEKDLVT